MCVCESECKSLYYTHLCACVLQALHKDTLGKVVSYNEYDIEHVYV